MNSSTIEQPIDVFGLARITAEQPMVAQDPNVARLSDGLIWRRRDLVWIGQARRHAGVEERREVTSGQVRQQLLNCRAVDLQASQQGVERLLVRLGQRRNRVERRQDLLFLLFGPGADQNRDLLAFAELLAEMAVDQPLGPLVEEQGTGPADFSKNVLESRELLWRVAAPVRWVLSKALCIDPFQAQRRLCRTV